jgi:hypothetical protein
VAVEVDHEAVPPEGVADRPGLEQAHVHPARRELLEHLEQASRGVVGQFGDDARLVRTGRGRQLGGATHEHESRDSVRVVADTLGEHLEVVVLGDARRCDRGIRKFGFEQGCRRRDIRRRRDVPVVRQVRVEPQVGLTVGDGMRVDDLHVGEGRALAGDEHEVHRHEVLADDPQVRDDRERVLRDAHPALDRVLDRDHCRDASPVHDVVERLTDVVHGAPGLARGLGHLLERGLGERAGGP